MQMNIAQSKNRDKQKRRRGWLHLLFVLPAFVYHFIVVVIPSFETLVYSFYDWNGIGEGTYIGLGNFREMLFEDGALRLALKNNCIWIAIFITIPIITGLFVAILISGVKKSGLQMGLRTVYFLPYVLSASIAGKIWTSLMNPYFGLPKVFGMMGLSNLADVLWLGDTKIALYSVAFVSFWSWWGFVMILMIAALQQIDPSLYEAATVDGCDRWQMFTHVTVPGIAPTIVFVIGMSLMWSVTSFDYVWVMTMGGPAQSTELLSTWIYKNAFVNYRAGYANAICILQSAIVLGIFFVNQFMRKRVEEIV